MCVRIICVLCFVFCVWRSGLNFDYEAHQPGTLNDSIAFASMVNGVQSGSRSHCTIDFPCDGDTCDPAMLAKHGSEERPPAPTFLRLIPVSHPDQTRYTIIRLLTFAASPTSLLPFHLPLAAL